MVHQTHNKAGKHGIKSPLRVSAITNQCVNCGSTFADRPTAQKNVVHSWTKGTCRTDRSHMPWSEVTQPISCNLCARMSWFANVPRTCPLDASALLRSDDPSELAWPVRQPRRNKQRARHGPEREPRVHQERRSGCRGATTPKAAPTNLTQNQGRRGNQRIDDSCGQAQSRRQVRAEELQ